MRLSLSIAGDVQVERDLLRLGTKVHNAKGGFRLLADELFKIESEQFKTQGGRASKWPELAESTVAAKGHDAILIDSGDLFRSLTNKGDSASKVVITPTEFRFGSTIPYLQFHQTGTSRMPQRRPLDLTVNDRKRLVKILQNHFLGTKARAR